MMKRSHSTINRDPNSLLKKWSRPIRLKNGRVLPAPSMESKQLAIEFLNWLKSKGDLSPNTAHRYLITLRKILSWCEMWNKTIHDMTYEDWVRVISEFSDDGIIHAVVKIILRWLYHTTGKEDYLKIYRLIRTPRPKTAMPDILSDEEVQRLIKACARLDFELKVLVETIYETGARVGEILSLRRKDIEFDEYGGRIYIRKSKSNFRCVRVIFYANDLLRLCEGKIPGDYLFKREYTTYLRLLDQAWKLAGLPNVKRKFHALRHTRATELLKKRIFTEQEMLKWFGWKTRKMIDVYSHITMEDVEEHYLSALLPNIDNSKDSTTKTKLCPRCALPITTNFNYCPRCGQPLTLEASYESLKKAEEKEKELEEAKKLIDKLLELAQKRPDLIRRLLGREAQG